MDIFGFFKQRRQRLVGLAEQRSRNRKPTGRIRIKSHIDEVLDPRSIKRLFTDIACSDPLNFPGYAEKTADLARRSNLSDAFICASGKIFSQPVICAELVPEFLMGSMGTAVGEAICRSAEYAQEQKLPLIIFSASGGARMQEGMFSLVQMAKTAGAIRRLSDSGGLFISILCNPTTGGVTASFASLGDIIIAEPGALIGFAGPRVIQQTINSQLPEGFQRSEFQLEHGFIDMIVSRPDLRETLGRLLALHKSPADKLELPEAVASLSGSTTTPALGFEQQSSEPAIQPDTPVLHTNNPSDQQLGKTPAQHVEIARNANRPHLQAFIQGLFNNFVQLRGDRLFADDRALVGGLATFEGLPVTVVGHQKGSDLNENIACNFGMPHPEGYRKFIRLAKAAEKFSRPLITFVDTPGAYPGAQAEERGQGEAIARCLFELSALKTPIITVITGEGGSGGALALSVADKVLMYEYAIYSVLSPEGFATILWKDAKRAAEAAAVMRLTAEDLQSFNLADTIIPEPEGGAHLDPTGAVDTLREYLRTALSECLQMDGDRLLEQRYQRFRRYEAL